MGESFSDAFVARLHMAAAATSVGPTPSAGVRGALARVFPDPVVVSATFEFARLASGRPFGVRIVDVSGRNVRQLRGNASEAGEAVLAWDGRDAAGARVSPGIYCYEVRSESSTGGGKLVVSR